MTTCIVFRLKLNDFNFFQSQPQMVLKFSNVFDFSVIDMYLLKQAYVGSKFVPAITYSGQFTHIFYEKV